MSRLTSNSKRYGPFEVGTTQYPVLQWEYSTGYDGDYPNIKRNTISLTIYKFCARISLPQIFKPLETKVIASTWSKETIERLGRNYYFEYTNRIYGFRFSKEYCQIFYGLNEEMGTDIPDGYKEKRIGFHLPWTQYDFLYQKVYDGNMQLVYLETKEDRKPKKDPTKKPVRSDSKYDLIKKMYKKKFKLLDYDNKEVMLDVYYTEMKWTKGTGSFSWLKYLFKPMVRKSIELNFEPAIGKKKNDWKGGLVSMGYDKKDDETIEECVYRFFKEAPEHYRELDKTKVVEQIA